MIKLSTVQLAQILQTKLIGDENVQVEEINMNTRKAYQIAYFFALKGENLMLINILIKRCHRVRLRLLFQQENSSISVPQLVVKDTRIALGELAKWLREKN